MESFLKPLIAFLFAFLLVITTGMSRFGSAPAVATASLIEQATERYESGQYQQAKTLWQAAAAAAADDPQRAVALGNLALTLQQLGTWDEADRAMAQSLKLLKSTIKSTTPTAAQLFDIQGHLAFDRGRFQPALDAWQQADAIYTKINDVTGRRINHLNQTQAMQMLGQFNQAARLLENLQSSTDRQTNPLLKVRERRSLLEVSAKLGRFDRLDQAAAIVTATDFAPLPPAQKSQEQAATFLTLGNITRSFAERDREITATAADQAQSCKTYSRDPAAQPALDHAQQAIERYQAASKLVPSNSPIALQSQLSQLSLQQELGQNSGALLPSIVTQLSQIPTNRTSIFARINLAQSLFCAPDVADDTIAQQLTQAIAQAQSIQDKRAESYALGTFGKLYERQASQFKDPTMAQRQLNYARQLSEKALQIADTIDAVDIRYQWEWQLARILRHLGGEANRQQAIAVYYPRAVKSLETVRGQLIGTNPDVQFSFRDDAEPVYREYVDLLLDEPNPSPQRLSQAIALIDSLQVAELENFFRCVLSQLVQINQVAQQQDPAAAIFYPIILPDRLEVILQLPNQAEPIHFTHKIPNAPQTIEHTSIALRDALVNDASYASEYKTPGEQIYRWLIQSAEADLAKAQVKTLVFVLDGGLRDIPVAALWDGNGFVIQKYAVAVTPGLKLLGPRRFEQQTFKALLGGLTGDQPSKPAIARQEFGALPNVKEEIAKLHTVISQSTVLVDREFVPSKLATALQQNSFPIVHLATHGIFSNNPKETYLVTADNQHIDIDALQALLRTGKGNRRDALELLMLSACETAKGNRRATLGMAGVAIRAGASSTVATLWSVDDRSTGKLVEQFYTNLRRAIEKHDGTTKVQALRQAQLALLENRLPGVAGDDATVDYSHPYYWSPFIMLGNWL
jgi:CHAT domain-containing protein